MIQPFEIFKESYIQRLIDLKKVYVVSQSYSRAIDHTAQVQKTSLLFTDYDDPGLAKIHLNAVKLDKYAAIVDLRNDKHVEKVRSMLEPGSNYTVYWNIVISVKKMEQRLTNRYTDNIRRYILKNTSWRIGTDEKILTTFEVTFGELFITLKRGSQTLRTKFEEIEKA